MARAPGGVRGVPAVLALGVLATLTVCGCTDDAAYLDAGGTAAGAAAARTCKVGEGHEMRARRDLVGAVAAEVARRERAQGHPVRVVVADGVCLGHDADHVPARVNLVVAHDRVLWAMEF